MPAQMSRKRPLVSREDLRLVLWAVLLGLAGAAAFAAYRAVSVAGEDTGGRLVEFLANLAWPGALILGGVGAAVFFGWKANLD